MLGLHRVAGREEGKLTASFRTRKMAQWARCLCDKCENLGLSPRMHVKQTGRGLQILALGRQRQGDLWGLLAT